MENITKEVTRLNEREGNAELYGPRCNPLFYTALPASPRFLSWNEIPGAEHYHITLFENSDSQTSLWSAVVPSHKQLTGELPALDLKPGVLYAWHAEPLFAPISTLGEQYKEGVPGKRAGSGFEARFWLLNPDALAHVQYGLGLLERSPDPDFALLARAILLSEAGLFQEALRLVRQGAKDTSSHIPMVLRDTALSIIYRQMERHLVTQEELPACLRTWVGNRENYYRSRVRAQMVNTQMQPPKTLGGKVDRRTNVALQNCNHSLNVMLGCDDASLVSL